MQQEYKIEHNVAVIGAVNRFETYVHSSYFEDPVLFHEEEDVFSVKLVLLESATFGPQPGNSAVVPLIPQSGRNYFVINSIVCDVTLSDFWGFSERPDNTKLDPLSVRIGLIEGDQGGNFATDNPTFHFVDKTLDSPVSLANILNVAQVAGQARTPSYAPNTWQQNNPRATVGAAISPTFSNSSGLTPNDPLTNAALGKVRLTAPQQENKVYLLNPLDIVRFQILGGLLRRTQQGAPVPTVGRNRISMITRFQGYYSPVFSDLIPFI